MRCSTLRCGTLAHVCNVQLHGCGHGIMNSVHVRIVYVGAIALSAIMTLQRALKELNSGKYTEQKGKRYMCMMATIASSLEAGNSWYRFNHHTPTTFALPPSFRTS